MYTKRSFNGASPRHNSNNRTSRGRNRQSKQYIHESKFINTDVVDKHDDANAYQPIHRFADFNFAPQIQKNLEFMKFDTPSAIQDQTIPLAMAGKDIIGLANTGTGKTAAFLLPIINSLNKDRKLGSVLIMAPTRELATQIDDEFRKFSAGMKLYSVLLVGGMNILPQLRGLQRGPHIIIGTPGRIKDHIERRSLRLGVIDHFVLDEADRMLDMGFVNDIRNIASQLPVERQTLCFSATFSEGVKAIANDFMREPEYVSVKVTETNDHIYQDVVRYTDPEHKKTLLMDLLNGDTLEKTIIFGETKFGVQRLSDMIDKAGIRSVAIHGNKSQGQRNRALNDFKNSRVSVLVATDVAARGLDIPNVSHVINFDTPTTYDDYVHRIGRTGRGGKNGSALTFVPEKGARVDRPEREERRERPDRNSRTEWRERRPAGTGNGSRDSRGPRPQASHGHDGKRSFSGSRKPRRDENSLMAAINDQN